MLREFKEKLEIVGAAKTGSSLGVYSLLNEIKDKSEWSVSGIIFEFILFSVLMELFCIFFNIYFFCEFIYIFVIFASLQISLILQITQCDS